MMILSHASFAAQPMIEGCTVAQTLSVLEYLHHSHADEGPHSLQGVT